MDAGRIIVTGGAGFIGSAVVRHLLADTGYTVLNLDKLTYAGDLASLESCVAHPRYRFERADICDRAAMQRAFADFQPDAVVHLAAESHVDRSIDGPGDFIQTNIVGTYVLLETARAYRATRPDAPFRFHHVSTDEVFGDLDGTNGFFTEETPYAPSSPYSASKAASDHLVQAWARTFGLPIVLTNCSNNYGPYQFPEKLIPVVLLNALAGKPLPVYGDGGQVRDWLYVEDHARALVRVLEEGANGETYNIGGHNEKTNLEVVRAICAILDELRPKAHDPKITGQKKQGGYAEQIAFVPDRPGHDRRYAIDAAKIQHSLGWVPQENFDSGLRKTVAWYLDHGEWCARLRAKHDHGARLGLHDTASAIAEKAS